MKMVFAASRPKLMSVAVAIIGLLGTMWTPMTSNASIPTPSSVLTYGPSAGCQRPSTQGSRTMTIIIGGHRRLVIVHVPTNWSSFSAIPLILNLHGSGNTAASEELLTGMDAIADEGGFIVAYPKALVRYGSGYVWNVPGVSLVAGGPVPTNDVNDVAFITTLVKVLEQDYCVNTRRVYAMGFSRGARMSSQLACDDSAVFAAVAAVSGLRRPLPCPTSRSVPLIALHGTADQTNPYGGSKLAMWTYSVPSAAQRWGSQDGCRISEHSRSTGYTLTRYSQCSSGAIVELYSLIGGGHDWPPGLIGPPPLAASMGLPTVAVNVDTLIWDFFKKFEMAKSSPA